MPSVETGGGFDWKKAEQQFPADELETLMDPEEAQELGRQMAGRLQTVLALHPRVQPLGGGGAESISELSHKVVLDRDEYSQIFDANHLQDRVEIIGSVVKRPDGGEYAYLEALRQDESSETIEIDLSGTTTPHYFATDAADPDVISDESELTPSMGALGQDIVQALEQSAAVS